MKPAPPHGLRARVDRWLTARTRGQLAVVVAALLAAIGVLDAATGYEVGVSVFYLLPVAAAAWYGGRRLGFGAAACAAIVWLLADIYAEHPYSQGLFALWNASMRLVVFVVVASLLVRLHAALRELTQLAQRDALTGLLNARALRERYEALAALAARNGQPIAVGYLDVDGFKRLNDTHGHATGDEVLRAIGEHLSQRLRSVDASGRLGGDEFAVVLAETDFDGARRVFEDVQGGIAALAAERRWAIGVSFGVVVFTAPPPSATHALAAADALMYRAKRQGGQRVVCESFDAVHPPPGWRRSGRSQRIEPRAEVSALVDGSV